MKTRSRFESKELEICETFLSWHNCSQRLDKAFKSILYLESDLQARSQLSHNKGSCWPHAKKVWRPDMQAFRVCRVAFKISCTSSLHKASGHPNKHIFWMIWHFILCSPHISCFPSPDVHCATKFAEWLKCSTKGKVKFHATLICMKYKGSIPTCLWLIWLGFYALSVSHASLGRIGIFEND